MFQLSRIRPSPRPVHLSHRLVVLVLHLEALRVVLLLLNLRLLGAILLSRLAGQGRSTRRRKRRRSDLKGRIGSVSCALEQALISLAVLQLLVLVPSPTYLLLPLLQLAPVQAYLRLPPGRHPQAPNPARNQLKKRRDAWRAKSVNVSFAAAVAKEADKGSRLQATIPMTLTQMESSRPLTVHSESEATENLHTPTSF
jgi:hypothetical protein